MVSAAEEGLNRVMKSWRTFRRITAFLRAQVSKLRTSSLRPGVSLFYIEQEHVDVHEQLIHPLQLDDIDNTKIYQDLELKTRIEYHPH